MSGGPGRSNIRRGDVAPADERHAQRREEPGGDEIESVAPDRVARDGRRFDARSGLQRLEKLAIQQDLARMVARLARPGDIVVCLGAGNITQWAYALPAELAALGAVA